MPTEAWDDLWQGMHSRAFVVAGAMKDGLLTDLRGAVDKAISEGTTLAEFRKDFDGLVEKNGWSYNGSRKWRTETIYDTNLSVAYATGHYKQRNNPAILKVRPYLRYLPSSSAHPRASHRQWYNIILRHDDPFWSSHTPPNGWGCKCGVQTASARDVARLEAENEESLYPVQKKAPPENLTEYVNKKTGRVLQVPAGIDPGWDYNPGRAAWGEKQSQQAVESWAASGDKKWKNMSSGNWQTHKLAEMLKPQPTKAALGEAYTETAHAVPGVEKILGGEEQIFSFAAQGIRSDVLVNAKSLVESIDDLPGVSPYLPLLREVLEDPQEIWVSFAEHLESGKVSLRQRLVKSVQVADDDVVEMVVQAEGGLLQSLTVTLAQGSVKARMGRLLYSKAEI